MKSVTNSKRDFDEAYVQQLVDSIDEVVIECGRLSTDKVYWRFIIGNIEIIVDAEDLDNSRVFNKKYIKNMNSSPISFSKNQWNAFLDILHETKTRIIEAREDSEEHIIAKETFNEICKLDPSDDPQTGLSGNSLYIYKSADKEYYCVTSKKITDILDALNYKISKSKLSSVMTELGFKKANTKTIRYGSFGSEMSWWFLPEVIDKRKEKYGWKLEGDSNELLL